MGCNPYNPAVVAAGATVAVANAIKASGVLVRVERSDFEKLLARAESPLVVTTTGGFFSRNYQYLVSYKGFAFFMKSSEPLEMPAGAEVVEAKSIWMPGG